MIKSICNFSLGQYTLLDPYRFFRVVYACEIRHSPPQDLFGFVFVAEFRGFRVSTKVYVLHFLVTRATKQTRSKYVQFTVHGKQTCQFYA